MHHPPAAPVRLLAASILGICTLATFGTGCGGGDCYPFEPDDELVLRIVEPYEGRSAEDEGLPSCNSSDELAPGAEIVLRIQSRLEDGSACERYDATVEEGLAYRITPAEASVRGSATIGVEGFTDIGSCPGTWSLELSVDRDAPFSDAVPERAPPVIVRRQFRPHYARCGFNVWPEPLTCVDYFVGVLSRPSE